MPTSAVASMVSATVRASSPFLMARVGSVTMVRTPAGHTNVFPGRRSMTPVVPNARRVRTSSARSSLEDTHTTGPGCRRIARILQNKPSLRLAPRHLKAQGLDWSCPPGPARHSTPEGFAPSAFDAATLRLKLDSTPARPVGGFQPRADAKPFTRAARVARFAKPKATPLQRDSSRKRRVAMRYAKAPTACCPAPRRHSRIIPPNTIRQNALRTPRPNPSLPGPCPGTFSARIAAECASTSMTIACDIESRQLISRRAS